jgi:spore maturation protein CgeB
MSFKLFSISSMYQGSIDLFYNNNPEITQIPYREHLEQLLEDTTEFVGSYIRNYRKLNIKADCLIANDINLQTKWAKEKGYNPDKKEEIIFDQVKSFSPDILMIENLSVVSSSLLQHIRHNLKSIKLIIANHCSPFNSKVLDSLKDVDFVLTCTPGLKSDIEGKGKKSFLVYHGFDADLLNWLNGLKEQAQNEFIFSGSLISGGDFHTERIRLIEQILHENIPIDLYVNLEKKYRIRAKQAIYLFYSFLKKIKMEEFFNRYQFLQFGKTRVESYSDILLKHKRPPVYGIDMFNLFMNSRIVLNFHIGVAGDYGGNMRMFEVTGVGSCLLTDNKKNMNDLFVPGSEVVTYDNPDDCIEKAKWLLNHEDERKKIALAGHLRTLKFHTVENRCRTIIDIIENELNHSIKIK